MLCREATPRNWRRVYSTIDTGAPRERPRNSVEREWELSVLTYKDCWTGLTSWVSCCLLHILHMLLNGLLILWIGDESVIFLGLIFRWSGHVIGLWTREHGLRLWCCLWLRGLVLFSEASGWVDTSARVWVAPLLVRLIGESILNGQMEQRRGISSSYLIQ